MAATDDIAEKVSDLLLDQTVRGGAFVTGAVPPAVRGLMHASSQTLRRLREQIKQDKDLRRLMGLQGEVSEEEMNEAIRKLGLISSTVHVADADAKEFADLLQERNILFAQVDKADDNCKMFVFLSRDADKVQEAATLMNARRGLVTELNPKLYFNGFHPEQVRETSGLDAVELEVFRHYARKADLVFTVMPNKAGTNNVYYELSEGKKADQVMMQVSWMLSGPRREQMRQQIEHRLDGRSAIEKALYEDPREMFVVSASNPAAYVHITEKDFTQYKNGKSVSSMSREKDGFAERCMAFCDGLEHPVVLSPDEFKTDLKATDMSRHPTTDFMAKGFDENREMEKLNRLISLVSRKSGLDNEHDADISLWDSSVSFSEFAANENFEDGEARREAEEDYEQLQAAARYGSRFSTEDLNMDQRNLDFIISRAEDKRRNRAAGESREREQDKDGLTLI